MDPVATTSLYTAIMRARESARPDRLFSDPFAAALAGPEGEHLLAWMNEQAPGSPSDNPVVSIRTKFFDDTLGRILAEPGIDQLVILAAGLDTRAYRLPLPRDLTLFELDRPEVLDHKNARLAQQGAAPRCRRLPIPADLTGDWSAALQDGGLDRKRPAAWLVEGLLQYITETQVHHVLGTLSGLASPGSWLLTDLVSHFILTMPQLAGFRAVMAANGSPWQFGTDDPGGLLAEYGWQTQVTRIGDDDANFGRWMKYPGFPDSAPYGFLVVAHR
jgi:methyltransferase (TIGR00027 family)